VAPRLLPRGGGIKRREASGHIAQRREDPRLSGGLLLPPETASAVPRGAHLVSRGAISLPLAYPFAQYIGRSPRAPANELHSDVELLVELLGLSLVMATLHAQPATPLSTFGRKEPRRKQVENCSREVHRVRGWLTPGVDWHGHQELQRVLSESRRDLDRLKWAPNPDRPPKLTERDRLGSPGDVISPHSFQIL
jgi:hypothetical protein